MRKRKGFFITFEGPEGSGKSTAIRAAARSVRRMGFSVTVIREPGGTRIGEKIRGVLLDRKNNRMQVETELCLYLAARAQIVREVIRPALEGGKVVISDRYHDSTAAYQGYAGGIDLKTIDAFGRFVKGGLEPDLTFLLDVETRTGLRRSRRSDRMERKSLTFHRKVREGFLRIARKCPRRIVVVRDEGELKTKVSKVESLLRRRMRKIKK